jgi:hypothetical protein
MIVAARVALGKKNIRGVRNREAKIKPIAV